MLIRAYIKGFVVRSPAATGKLILADTWNTADESLLLSLSVERKWRKKNAAGLVVGAQVLLYNVHIVNGVVVDEKTVSQLLKQPLTGVSIAVSDDDVAATDEVVVCGSTADPLSSHAHDDTPSHDDEILANASSTLQDRPDALPNILDQPSMTWVNHQLTQLLDQITLLRDELALVQANQLRVKSDLKLCDIHSVAVDLGEERIKNAAYHILLFLAGKRNPESAAKVHFPMRKSRVLQNNLLSSVLQGSKSCALFRVIPDRYRTMLWPYSSTAAREMAQDIINFCTRYPTAKSVYKFEYRLAGAVLQVLKVITILTATCHVLTLLLGHEEATIANEENC